ncbi:MAG: phosphotransferase [Bacteroidales bacterium]|nr:phosphotransferase [Bacteroidales bacterium]
MDDQILSLYLRHFGFRPAAIQALTGSAGNRRYLRLMAPDGTSVIGAWSGEPSELNAFCELSQSMLAQGLRVPRVLARSGSCYLQTDLGAVSLYDLIVRCQKNGCWDEETCEVLRQVMRDLPEIQFKALRGFDLNHCCREQVFSARNIRWDLNYFKYCFIKGTGVNFDEVQLQEEFDALEQRLLEAPNSGFLYRDFQSRNIQVKDGLPYYIDFQAGYQGPVYYDVASFLWQARAGYPESLRQELLAVYRDALRPYLQVSDEEFHYRLRQFVFFRLLQVLGAYGFRGIFERKAAFLSPIPKALAMIVAVAEELQEDYPYLLSVLREVAACPNFQPSSDQGRLTVRITSFSFKKGVPNDFSGNGGGFVFDCRAPHNPGRYREYKHLTGLDQPVIDFLEGRDHTPGHEPFGMELTMLQFLEHVYALVDPAVDTYLHRGFTHLMVSFGCTGGQHRSVYGAQHLAQHLKQHYPDLDILLVHRELGIEQHL